MRVKLGEATGVKNLAVDAAGNAAYGELVGLLIDERGETQAVVRIDGHGLMLKAIHPSRIDALVQPGDGRDLTWLLQLHTDYERLLQAVKIECAKFTFPDEDRPDLWEALQRVEGR